ALRKLAESGELGEISRRHARYYEGRLMQATRPAKSRAGCPRYLAANLNDIRAAMDWAISSRGELALGVRLAAYSASMWLGIGLLAGCRERRGGGGARRGGRA